MIHKKWLGLLALMPALGMIFMDQTILPVALPTIQRDFHASAVLLEWCVNSYLLVTTMFALIGGKIGDRIGHRLTVFLGIIFFTVSSILCGFSPNIACLIIARGLQGLGAALMIPSFTPLVAALFGAHERGKAVGFNASISSLFLIMAPLIGGFLTEALSWRWIFWINIPLALAGILLIRTYLPKLPPNHAKIDGWGSAAFALGAASLTLLFMNGVEWGWLSWPILLCAIITLGAALLLIKRERTIAAPFLDLALFKRPLFAAINVSISITAFILMISVFRAIYFQTVLDYSPTDAGLITSLTSLPVLFAASIAGYLSDRLTPKLPTAIGYLLIIGSLFWLAFDSVPSLMSLSLALLAFGFGIPFIFTPSYSSAMNAVPQTKLGVAMGIVATLRMLASTMGIALIGMFMSTVASKNLAAGGSERQADIASFSAVHYALAFLMILAFAGAFLLHARKSAHHLPESPAEGYD